MSEKKKISVSLKTPPYLFMLPFLGMFAYAKVYEAAHFGGFSYFIYGFMIALPVVALSYGMILVTVKEYTEQGVERILEALEEREGQSPSLSKSEEKADNLKR